MPNGSSAQMLSRRSGFSLVELMVAVGILGFTVIAVMAFFLNAVTLNAISRNQTTALSHAQYVLEDIRNATFANVPTQITGGTWNWNTAAIAAKGFTTLKDEAVATTTNGTTLLTVTVTVTWEEASGRQMTVSLTTEMGGA